MPPRDSTSFNFFDFFREFVDDGFMAQLRPAELAVFIVLLRHADRDGVAWPGKRLIADRIGMKMPHSVTKYLNGLKSKGFIFIVGSTKCGRGKATKRRIALPRKKSVQSRHSIEKSVQIDTKRVLKQPHIRTQEEREGVREGVDDGKRPYDNYNLRAAKEFSGRAMKGSAGVKGHAKKAA